MVEPWKVLVVDDEAPARAKVRRFLAEDVRFRMAAEAADGIAALEALRVDRPDLVVLDVQMPGLTGFEVLEALEPPHPHVLFATAYDQYALDAFEANAVDYLLKPFDGLRFHRALERTAALLQAGRPAAATGLLPELARKRLERLVVKLEDRWLPLPLRSVRRLSVDGKQVRVVAEAGTFQIRASLAELEARLDPGRFVRVHRGDIVALDAVSHMEPWDHGDALLVLRDGGKVVLSRTHRAAFLERWGFSG